MDDGSEIIAWLSETRPDEKEFPVGFDADRIYGNLFQGSQPPKGELIAQLGFHVLVLCADEFQPGVEDFPGVELIHMPSGDYDHIPPTEAHLVQVQRTAERVVERLNQNKAVLVTCRGGFNRSGIVTGTVLNLWNGWEGEKCVRWVKDHRDYALHNKQFAIHVKSLCARK
jgi:protein-tyrosine phosphatase